MYIFIIIDNQEEIILLTNKLSDKEDLIQRLNITINNNTENYKLNINDLTLTMKSKDDNLFNLEKKVNELKISLLEREKLINSIKDENSLKYKEIHNEYEKLKKLIYNIFTNVSLHINKLCDEYNSDINNIITNEFVQGVINLRGLIQSNNEKIIHSINESF